MNIIIDYRKKDSLDGTRTRNFRIRSPAPYPIGSQGYYFIIKNISKINSFLKEITYNLRFRENT